MDSQKSSSATPQIPSRTEPTVRRVKGSRNLSSALSDFDGSPAVMLDAPRIIDPLPYIQYLVPKPLQIRKAQLPIAPVAPPSDLQKIALSEAVPRRLRTHKSLRSRKRPPHTTPIAHPSEVQETSPATVVEALRIHKSLPKNSVSVPEPLRISTSRPPITSSAGSAEASKHSLEVALKPTPRRPARRPTTVKSQPQSTDLSTKQEQEKSPVSSLISSIPLSPQSLVAPTSVLWELRMSPDLGLGGNLIPPPPRSPRSRRKSWKKSCRFVVKRRVSLLRNLSKKLRFVKVNPLTNITEQASVALPHGRNLVVEKRDLLREDKTALEREVRDLKQQVGVLERERDEAKSDALREAQMTIHCEQLLRVECEKVKVLQAQLQNQAQIHVVPTAASATESHVDQRTYTSGITQVGTDVAAMRNTRSQGLEDGKEHPSGATPFLIIRPNSSSEQHRERDQAHTLAPPRESSIHELPATLIGEFPSHSVEGIASASGETLFTSEMETPFQLQEVDRTSIRLSELFGKFDEAYARIIEGHGETELQARSSPVASEVRGRKDAIGRISGTQVPHLDPNLLEEEHFRFLSPKD